MVKEKVFQSLQDAGHRNKRLLWLEHEIPATERPRAGCITHVGIQNTKGTKERELSVLRFLKLTYLSNSNYRIISNSLLPYEQPNFFFYNTKSSL